MLASPGPSQGFRKRERFLMRTGSQPGSDTPVLQFPARPVSAPATGNQCVGGPYAEHAASPYDGQQPHVPAAALTEHHRTANTGTEPHGSGPGAALKNPVTAATYRNHMLRGSAGAAAAEQQHALRKAPQQQVPPGSSTPVQAPRRPELLAISHSQQVQGRVPTPAMVGSALHQPQQQLLPPDCSLPGPATGTKAQSAKPEAHQCSAALKHAKQNGPASAQGGAVVQRTHHQHISLKETYRESKQAAPPHSAPGQAAMSGEQHDFLDKHTALCTKIPCLPDPPDVYPLGCLKSVHCAAARSWRNAPWKSSKGRVLHYFPGSLVPSLTFSGL